MPDTPQYGLEQALVQLPIIASEALATLAIQLRIQYLRKLDDAVQVASALLSWSRMTGVFFNGAGLAGVDGRLKHTSATLRLRFESWVSRTIPA
jgi:hypothetical protein